MIGRRKHRSAVVITMALTAGCAGSGSSIEGGGARPPTGPSVNPPPISESLIAPGGVLARRHSVCTLDGAPMDCPPALASDGKIVRDEEGVCMLVEERCPSPVMATCNPPPPQPVRCDESAIASGTQYRVRDGECMARTEVRCPEPYQPPCVEESSREIDCPRR